MDVTTTAGESGDAEDVAQEDGSDDESTRSRTWDGQNFADALIDGKHRTPLVLMYPCPRLSRLPHSVAGGAYRSDKRREQR